MRFENNYYETPYAIILYCLSFEALSQPEQWLCETSKQLFISGDLVVEDPATKFAFYINENKVKFTSGPPMNGRSITVRKYSNEQWYADDSSSDFYLHFTFLFGRYTFVEVSTGGVTYVHAFCHK